MDFKYSILCVYIKLKKNIKEKKQQIVFFLLLFNTIRDALFYLFYFVLSLSLSAPNPDISSRYSF